MCYGAPWRGCHFSFLFFKKKRRTTNEHLCQGLENKARYGSEPTLPSSLPSLSIKQLLEHLKLTQQTPTPAVYTSGHVRSTRPGQEDSTAHFIPSVTRSEQVYLDELFLQRAFLPNREGTTAQSLWLSGQAWKPLTPIGVRIQTCTFVLSMLVFLMKAIFA